MLKIGHRAILCLQDSGVPYVGLATQKTWNVYRKDGISWKGLENLRGDMNGDGELSVGDVTILINKIVNRQ